MKGAVMREQWSGAILPVGHLKLSKLKRQESIKCMAVIERY